MFAGKLLPDFKDVLGVISIRLVLIDKSICSGIESLSETKDISRWEIQMTHIVKQPITAVYVRVFCCVLSAQCILETYSLCTSNPHFIFILDSEFTITDGLLYIHDFALCSNAINQC